jgi:prepilin-type N-terminal cleavage/methylation domain-containing protein
MENKNPPSASEGGFTLVELMMVIALISIITPAITYLFSKMSQGMAADEMRNQMITLNESSLLRIHERVLSSRHMCQGDANGLTYQAAVVAGMTAQTTTNYPILAGSQLALSQPATTFSPLLSTPADFGNSLLFGAYDCSEVLYKTWGGTPKSNFTAPITIFTQVGQAIQYANGQPATQILDVYRFYYYYLTAPIINVNRPVTCYKLIEWQSIQYVDFNELTGITDTTLLGDVCKYLLNTAYFSSGVAISNAWDPTQGTAAGAFYTITSTSPYYAATAGAAVITEAQCLPVTRINSGILSTGFTYGVCPNTLSWNSCPVTVPEFCTTPSTSATKYPGGFEVGISGSSDGMEVLVRSVLAAKGAAKLPVINDSTLISNVKDIW